MEKSNKLKINSWSIICFLAGVLPILPGYFNVFGFSAVNVVVSISFLMIILLNHLRIRVKRNFPKITIVFICFVIYQWISYIIFGDYLEIIWSALLWIGVGFFTISYIDSPNKFLTIIDILIKVSAIVCIAGIIESFTKFNIFELLNNSDSVLYYNPLRFGLRRIIGFGYQTITYCIYIMFIASLTWYRLTQLGKGKKKRLYISIGVGVFLIIDIILFIIFLPKFLMMSRICPT